MDDKLVYIISGPLGVGKSCVAKEIGRITPKCFLIEGDLFLNATEHLPNIDWHTRLRMSWENILCQTKICLKRNLNVVIDFVVEDELGWFRSELEPHNVKLFYTILYAEKDVILERLANRDDLKYKDRSFKLLEQLKNEKENDKYLYDTTNKDIESIAQEIHNKDRFIVK